MAKWDIQPIAARDVLARTQSIASEFLADVTAMESSMRGAGAESSSGLIAAALQGFAQSCSRDTRFVFDRTGAALTGASDAVHAYLQGDHEMVLNAQAQAARAPEPGDRMPGRPQ